MMDFSECTGGLSKAEAEEVGRRNNFAAKAPVRMDFPEFNEGLSHDAALKVGYENNYNTLPGVVMDFSECTGGLSRKEAKRVGHRNEQARKPVRIDIDANPTNPQVQKPAHRPTAASSGS